MRNIPKLPHPGSHISDPSGLCTREWYDKLDELVAAVGQRMPITGTIQFTTSTSALVTFTNAEANTEYNIHWDAPEDRRVWVTDKSTSGFIARVNSTSSETYGWTLVRR